MRNIITNIAIVTFAIIVPTASMVTVMGAIASGIDTTPAHQTRIK